MTFHKLALPGQGELWTIYLALPYVKSTGLYSLELPNDYNISFDYYSVLIFLMILYIPSKSFKMISRAMFTRLLTLSRPLSHLCDGRSHSFRDHGRRKQRLYSDFRNFFVLSPLVLRVVSFERGNSALSDDVWYCSGWYWKFLQNIDLKSRHAKCVRSAWPVCVDSVARCSSSTTCASMELARCGSSATCA